MDSNSEATTKLLNNNYHPMFINQTFFRTPLENELNSLLFFKEKFERDLVVISNFLEKKITQEVDQTSLLRRVDKVLEKLWSLHELLTKSQEKGEANIANVLYRLNRIIEEIKNSEDSEDSLDMMGSRLYLSSIINEYLLRKGFFKTSEMLTEQENLSELVDSSLYLDCHKIVQSLKNHDIEPALNWCKSNQTALKHNKIELESKLHLQHLVELADNNKSLEVVNYMQKKVPVDIPDMKKVLTYLVLNDSNYQPSSKYFENVNWQATIQAFEDAFAAVNDYSPVSTIELLVQAGLSTLKTPECYEGKSSVCPACLLGNPEYLKRLPPPHHIQSNLICQITGELMTAENIPYVSPKGRIYSENGLKLLESKSPDGQIECPTTQQKFYFKDCKKLYIT